MALEDLLHQGPTHGAGLDHGAQLFVEESGQYRLVVPLRADERGERDLVLAEDGRVETGGDPEQMLDRIGAGERDPRP